MNRDNTTTLPFIEFITNKNNKLRKNSANQGWQKTTLALAMAIIASPNYAEEIHGQEGIGAGAGTAVTLGGSENTASGPFSGVFSGVENAASGAGSAVIAGGENTASGDASGIFAGQNSTTSGEASGVIAGINNTASAEVSGVFAGGGNKASGVASAVIAGGINKAEGDFSVVIGGGSRDNSKLGNLAKGDNTLVGAGQENKAYGKGSVILGGIKHTTGKEGTDEGRYSGVLAGRNNSTNGYGSGVIAGGFNTVNGKYSGIIAGMSNTATSGKYSGIVAGERNTVGGVGSGILAGWNNRNVGQYTAIVAGSHNSVSHESLDSSILAGQVNSITGDASAVIAGVENTVTSSGSAVIAGSINTINSRYSGILAGENNSVGGYSSAIVAGDFNKVKAGGRSVILGGGGDSEALGNFVSGYNTVVGGGQANKIYANDSIVFGTNNTVGADRNRQDKVYILGSGVDASNISNAVVFGDNSTAVSGAISIGSAGGERQIKFVKAGSDQTDAVNFGQLNDLAKATSTDIDVAAWKTKLGIESGGSGGNSMDLSQYYQKTEIYNQNEVDTKLADKADRDAANLSTTDVDKWQRKLGVGTGGVDMTNYYTKVEVRNSYATKNEVAKNRQQIINNAKRIDQIEGNANYGLASVAAMSVLNLGNVPTGKVGIGAAIGGYGNKKAISVGMTYGVNNNLRVNGKVGFATSGSGQTAWGVSGLYVFD